MSAVQPPRVERLVTRVSLGIEAEISLPGRVFTGLIIDFNFHIVRLDTLVLINHSQCPLDLIRREK